MTRRTSITHVPTFGSLFLLFVSSGSCLHAQTVAPLCTPTDYKIVSLAIITIQCDEDVSQLVGEAQLLDAASGPGKPLVSSIPVTPYEEATQWLILNLGPGRPALPAGPLQLGKKYTVAVSPHPPGQASSPGVAPFPAPIPIDHSL